MWTGDSTLGLLLVTAVSDCSVVMWTDSTLGLLVSVVMWTDFTLGLLVTAVSGEVD